MKVQKGCLLVKENYNADGGAVDIKNFFGVPSVGTWVLIELSLDFGSKTMGASVNGVAKMFPITDTAGATSMRLRLAETGDSDTEHMAARFDDFECTVK